MSSHVTNSIKGGIDEEPSTMRTIAKKINALMEQHQVSIEALSEGSHISMGTISSIKRGEANPSIGTLSALAAFFNVQLSTLLDSETTEALKRIVTVDIFDLRHIHDHDKQPIMKHLVEKFDNYNSNDLFGVIINNSLLSPIYEKGTLFIANKNTNIADGDLIIARLHDRTNVIKRCIIKDNSYYLQELLPNSDFEAYDNTQIRILGRVIHIVQTIG